MGWNSWNTFGCNVSEALIKSMADAMVSRGMQAAGYQYVNIDDCWMDGRDANGKLADQEFVTLGWGREYLDVTPLRGVVLGAAEQQLAVAVKVTPMTPEPVPNAAGMAARGR